MTCSDHHVLLNVILFLHVTIILSQLGTCDGYCVKSIDIELCRNGTYSIRTDPASPQVFILRSNWSLEEAECSCVLQGARITRTHISSSTSSQDCVSGLTVLQGSQQILTSHCSDEVITSELPGVVDLLSKGPVDDYVIKLVYSGYIANVQCNGPLQHFTKEIITVGYCEDDDYEFEPGEEEEDIITEEGEDIIIEEDEDKIINDGDDDSTTVLVATLLTILIALVCYSILAVFLIKWKRKREEKQRTVERQINEAYEMGGNEGVAYDEIDDKGMYDNTNSTEGAYETVNPTEEPYDNANSTEESYDNANSTEESYDNANSTEEPYDNANSTDESYDNANSTEEPHDDVNPADGTYDNNPAKVSPYDMVDVVGRKDRQKPVGFLNRLHVPDFISRKNSQKPLRFLNRLHNIGKTKSTEQTTNLESTGHQKEQE